MTVIFSKTSNTSRGGLSASLPLWSKEQFIKDAKAITKDYRNSIYRYGYVGGYLKLLKEMTLKEFDELFPENPFSKEAITNLFCKEVSIKHGEHADKLKQVFLKKKDIIQGKVYTDHNGVDWVYLGEVEQNINKMAYRSKWEIDRANYSPEINTGHGFLLLSDLKYGDIADRVWVLKTMKKFVCEAHFTNFSFQIPESLEMVYESGLSKNSNYRGHEKVVIVKIFK